MQYPLEISIVLVVKRTRRGLIKYIIVMGNPNRSQKTLLKPIYGVVNNVGSYMSPTASYNELKEYSNHVIQTGMTVYGGAKVLKGIGTAASGISYGSGLMSLANSMAVSPGISTSMEAGVLLEGMNTSFQGSGILMAESMAGSGDIGGTSGKPSEGAGQLGENEPKIGGSKTIWQKGKTERIDIENPSLGKRPGDIAPSKIQNVLKNKDIQKAIYRNQYHNNYKGYLSSQLYWIQE